MASKFRIVDTDAHYVDNPRELWKYMDEPWRSRIRDWSGKYYQPAPGGAVGDSLVGGRIKTGKGHKIYNDNEVDHQGISSSKQVVTNVMNEFDFEAIVLIPSYLLHVAKINDRERAVVLANAHAEYMLEHIVSPDKGIYCALPVPVQDPQASKELIEQFGNEPGFCAILTVTQGPVPPLGSIVYDPVYQAAQKFNLPVICHSGFSGPDANTYAIGMEKWAEAHSLDFAFNNMIHLTSVVMQGVKERFPDLDFVFQEAGIFYIPQMMFRLDTEYMRRRSEVPILKKLPSEYIKDMFFGTQPLEITPKKDYLKFVFDMIDGENTLMYASDWPHYDWDHPSVIEKLPFLSTEAKEKVLGGNAREVFRFQTSRVTTP